jgi:hypothetical protein
MDLYATPTEITANNTRTTNANETCGGQERGEGSAQPVLPPSVDGNSNAWGRLEKTVQGKSPPPPPPNPNNTVTPTPRGYHALVHTNARFTW